MNTFVILFRRPGPAMPDADRLRLNAETATWAKTCNAAGHALDPRILSAERVVRSADAAHAPTDAPIVSALLFLQADDLDAAVRIAEAHPGLRYGFNVEVRPWATPAAAAAALNSRATVVL